MTIGSPAMLPSSPRPTARPSRQPLSDAQGYDTAVIDPGPGDVPLLDYLAVAKSITQGCPKGNINGHPG